MYKVNICEPLLNAVNPNKPKWLIGLDQNGKWSSVDVATSSTVDIVPPAKRRNLSTSIAIHAERGKPVSLPIY